MVITGIITLIISILFWYVCHIFAWLCRYQIFASGFSSQTRPQLHISWPQRNACKPSNELKLTKQAWKISTGNDNSKFHCRRRTWREFLTLFRFIEAFTDPKVWVMAAFAAIGSVLLGILKDLLFTYLQKCRQFGTILNFCCPHTSGAQLGYFFS